MLEQQIGGRMIFQRPQILKLIHSPLSMTCVRLSLIQLIFFQANFPVLSQSLQTNLTP